MRDEIFRFLFTIPIVLMEQLKLKLDLIARIIARLFVLSRAYLIN